MKYLEQQTLNSATQMAMQVLARWEQENNKMFHEAYPNLEDELFKAIDNKSSHGVFNIIERIENIIGE